ncbi:LysR family transcriptional regulator [Cedecea lapagei]|uniref:LysR family transcriptional regulator n=1 Tax=Cedecea lapagei TaxID=158823 RepID=UPI001BCCBEA8|nr:LysR family transcriptional regulator [Cedecea lapagei]
MDRIDAMKMLLTTVETGSFSAAGRALRVPVQTVSRNVADLERYIGTQLLTRSTRKISLTDAGATYVASVKNILEQIADAERIAAGEFVEPRGDLVLSAPELFGRRYVLPIVTEFLKIYSEINVRLILSDRNLDLIDEQIDMVVRIGHLPDSGMVAIGVGSVRAVVCGSPEYLASHGVPQTPQDLIQMPCISTNDINLTSDWRFVDAHKGYPIELPLAFRLKTSAAALVDAAVDGIGLARLLHYQAFDALESGELSLVLTDYELPAFPVHLLHAAYSPMPLKMRRFLDFASPRLREALAHFTRKG